MRICVSSCRGFTLIELSIAFVVVGLLIGAITIGSVLVRSAQVNGVIVEVNEYKTAIGLFQHNYDALPGDLRDAYDYWGDDCDVDPAECNGNANGKIDYAEEDEMAWVHLELAGYVPSKYTTVGALKEETPALYAALQVKKAYEAVKREVEQIVGVPSAHAICVIYPDPVVPIDLPTSNSIDEGGYWMVETDIAGDPADTDDLPVVGNAIHFGTVASGLIRGGVLTPTEAYTVDTKYDDGIATTGWIMGKDAFETAGCLDSGSSTGYRQVADQRRNCYEVFWLYR